MASDRQSVTPARRAAPLLMAASCGLLLAACGSSGDSEALLSDYQRELAQRLGLEAPAQAAPANIGAFPERRDRLMTIPETREGMFNIYALRACHITTLVAERNSALGRVAPASHQWRYELTLWQRLEECLASDVPESLGEADRERLERLAATKTEQLPKATWNGLFGSDAWAGSFSRVSSPLPPESLTPPAAQLEALNYLQQLSEAPAAEQPLPDLDALSGHLRALNERPYTAELLRTLMLATQRLDEASALIERSLDQHDGCSTTALSSGLEETPLEERLAGWLTRLEQGADAWTARLTPLFTSLDSPPEPVRRYHDAWIAETSPTAPLNTFQAARERHLELREAHAQRCR